MKNANTRLWTLVLALAVGCMMALSPTGAVTSTGEPYGWSQQHTYVAPGALCTLSVWVDTTDDSLGCVECWVSFDTTLVTLVAASEGALFTGAGAPGLFYSKEVASDTHSVEGCLLGYQTYGLTPGELAQFVFRADNPGICPVRIEKLNLWDIDRVLFEPAVDADAWIVIGTATGVPSSSAAQFRFYAYPNPFNPETTLVLSASPGTLGSSIPVDLSIYSAAGRRVKQLFNGEIDSPSQQFIWNGRNDVGNRVPSGVYFAVLTAGDARLVHKLVLVQ